MTKVTSKVSVHMEEEFTPEEVEQFLAVIATEEGRTRVEAGLTEASRLIREQLIEAGFITENDYVEVKSWVDIEEDEEDSEESETVSEEEQS